MRKGIRLKAIFTDEEKSLKRFRNYEIEDLGQDGTVYLRNDKNKILKFEPSEIKKAFNIVKSDRRRLVVSLGMSVYGFSGVQRFNISALQVFPAEPSCNKKTLSPL